MLIIFESLYLFYKWQYNRVMDGLSVTEYIKKAFESKDSGNYKQAIEYFYKALNIDSESSEIMSEIASLYFKISNPERAIEYYEQALLVDPFNLNIKFSLALVYKYIGNMEKTVALLESIYSKNNKLEYLIELVHTLYLEGKYEEAVSLYNKSMYKDSESDMLHYYVGLASFSLGNFEDAQKMYRIALKVNPNNQEVRFALAELLFEKKDYNEAETLLLKVLEHKLISKAYYLLGELNFAKNNFDKAVNYLAIASNIDLKNPVYFYELATVYSLKGFLREAEENFLKAIKLSPNNLLYNYAIAYLYYQMGELSKVNQKISYILSINPHHLDALTLKALIASDEDDVITANKLIDEVLASTSSSDFAYYVKSLLYKKLSWWEKAIETINKALDIRPKSLEYLSELAVYYYEAKFYGDTKKICKKIIDIDNKFLFAYIMLGKVYFLNKDYKAALINLDKAIELDKNADEAYFVKAQILKETNVKVTALDNAKIAVSIAPNKVEYFEFIAQCYYDLENYKDAYFYFKEASDLDVLNVRYKFYMAKCSQNLNEVSNAISNYSIAKRLDPSNVSLALEYAEFLCSVKRHKMALEILKSSIQYNPSSNEQEAVNLKIKEIEDTLSEKSVNLKKIFSNLKSKK